MHNQYGIWRNETRPATWSPNGRFWIGFMAGLAGGFLARWFL